MLSVGALTDMRQFTKTLVCTCLYTIGVGYIAASFGSNLWFLSGSAAELLNNEDLRLLREAANEAISDPATPALRRWKNERTGHHGELRTLAAFTGPNAIPCKRLQVVNHAGGRDSKAAYTLCDIPPDGWKLVPSDFASPPRTR